MKVSEYKKLCKKAVAFNDKENYIEAIKILKLLSKEDFAKTDLKFHFMMGRALVNMNKHEEAIKVFKDAIEIEPKSEVASLGLYLSYAHTNKNEKAIEEIKRYLDKYSPNLYKDTLKELLRDFRDGYATNFKEVILPLAEKYNVKI